MHFKEVMLKRLNDVCLRCIVVLIFEVFKLLKIKTNDFFAMRPPILVSPTVKTRKFKLLRFRNESCFGAGNMYKDLFSIYLQPNVNKNS